MPAGATKVQTHRESAVGAPAAAIFGAAGAAVNGGTFGEIGGRIRLVHSLCRFLCRLRSIGGTQGLVAASLRRPRDIG